MSSLTPFAATFGQTACFLAIFPCIARFDPALPHFRQILGVNYLSGGAATKPGKPDVASGKVVTMRCRNPLAAVLRGFLRRDDGAATVEAVLWLPFFIALFGILVDISVIFHGQASLLRIVQDANRNRTVNRLTTDQDTMDWVVAQSAGLSSKATATSSITAGLISTTVTVPINDLDLFGVASVFNGVNMTVNAEHLMEY